MALGSEEEGHRQMKYWALFWVLFFTGCAPIQHHTTVIVGDNLVERAYADASMAMQFFCKGRCEIPLMQSKHTPAAQVMLINGEPRIMMYNRDAMAGFIDEFGYAAVVGVFAHEIGHIVDLADGDTPEELSADAWAGCALGLMGESPEAYALLLAVHAPITDVHPDPAIRRTAAIDGHNMCVDLLK